MPQYRDESFRLQDDKFGRLFHRAESQAQQRHQLRLQMNAESRLRITVLSGLNRGLKAPQERPGGERSMSAERSLVYSHELQRSINEEQKNEPKPRPEAISRYAKSTIREGCAILERRYGKKVAFITLTLPGSTQEAIERFAWASRDVLNSFLQRLRDNYARRRSQTEARPEKETVRQENTDIEYVAVWEYQARGALHLHLAIGETVPGFFKWMRRNVRKVWTRVLETLSDRFDVDLFGRAAGGSWRGVPGAVRTEVARVKKSVRRYMAKYLSKGNKQVKDEGLLPPSRWWGMSKALRALVEAERQTVTYVFQDYAEASQLVALSAEVAREDANACYLFKHGLTGEAMGYTMYFDDGVGQAIFETLCKLSGVGLRDGPFALLPERQHGPGDDNGEVYVV